MTQRDNTGALAPYLSGLKWGFLVLGIAVLVLQFAHNRSLWLDEASLALNIQQRDLAQLMRPLDYDQSAPLGFLAVVEGITAIFGISEYSLRLLPLIMGITTLVLFMWVGGMVAPHAVPLGIALLATSPIHIDYATEFKQYALDATFALWHLGLALRISKNPSRANIAVAGISGAVAVWFSHPIIFVLAGVGLVLFVDALHKQQWRVLMQLAGMGLVQVVSFGWVYFVAYRDVLGGTALASFMNHFWADRFLQLSLYAVVRFIFEVFIHLAGIGQMGLLVLVIYGFGLGIIGLPWRVSAFILMPMLAMCGASLLQLYPLSDRFLLYLLAPLMLIVARGWHGLIHTLGKQMPSVSVMLLVVLAGLLILRIPVPIYKDDVRGAFAWLESIRPPDDPVYAIILTGRTGAYYGYDTLPFPAPIPSDRRVWIVIDRPLAQARLHVNHVAYRFLGIFDIFVMCIPTDDMPCPP